MTNECVLHLRCIPNWNAVEELRQYLGCYMRRRFAEATAEQLMIAAWELLENAVTHGSVVQDIEFELYDWGASGGFEIRVTNAAIAARVESFLQHAEQLKGADPEQAYAEAMNPPPATPGAPTQQMLGLVRIAYEASMEIDVQSKGQFVTVSARATAPPCDRSSNLGHSAVFRRARHVANS